MTSSTGRESDAVELRYVSTYTNYGQIESLPYVLTISAWPLRIEGTLRVLVGSVQHK
jgi:hypothetical protein